MTASLNCQPAKRDDARGLCAHAYRYGAQESDRIDSERSHLNRVLAGPNTFIGARAEINSIRREQPDGRKVRSDANVIAQMIATLPGELDDDQLNAWCETTVEWAREQAPGRLLYAVLHRDESRSHIHLALVPEEDTGKLSYKALYGGEPRRKKGAKAPPAGALKMIALQDSYAEALAPLGVARGLRGAEYKHTGMSSFRKLIEETKIEQARALGRAEAREEARNAAKVEVADELTVARERAAGAEARAADIEVALEQATAALSSPLEVVLLPPAPRPPTPEKKAARKDEDEAGRWIPSERPAIPQKEVRRGGPGNVLMRLPWLVALRDWMRRQATLRAQLISKYPRLLGHLQHRQDPLQQALQRARDNVRRLNDRGNQSIIAREATENIPESESATESIPISADAAKSLPDNDSTANDVHDDEDGPRSAGLTLQ